MPKPRSDDHRLRGPVSSYPNAARRIIAGDNRNTFRMARLVLPRFCKRPIFELIIMFVHGQGSREHPSMRRLF